MIIIFAFLLLLMCVGCRIHLKGLDENYLSMNYTQAIKGIFIIFVFLSHVRTYAEYTLASDLFVIRILDYLGQLMVAMFLFYSGYGVFESVKKKGKTYIDSFVINRIGKTFIDFSFAICLFLIVDVIVEKTYSIPHILLSFTGWTSVGNSNWYMFTIFALYLMTFICFKIGGNKRLISLILFTVCSFGYVFIMSAIHQPTRFSNTSLCYMAGMWYSYFKSEIDCFLKKHQFYYYVITLCLIGLYLYTYPFKGTRLLWFNGVSILFSLVIVFLSMKISCQNSVLIYFGKHLFWVYILQRIPMILLSFYHINDFPYIFLILCFLITIFMSHFINIMMISVKNKIFSH